jgi:hypothetical protein
LQGQGYPGAGFAEMLYLVNVDKTAHTLTLPEEAGKAYRLHPVQASPAAGDASVRTQAHFDRRNGGFTVPPRSTAVFVVQ